MGKESAKAAPATGNGGSKGNTIKPTKTNSQKGSTEPKVTVTTADIEGARWKPFKGTQSKKAKALLDSVQSVVSSDSDGKKVSKKNLLADWQSLCVGLDLGEPDWATVKAAAETLLVANVDACLRADTHGYNAMRRTAKSVLAAIDGDTRSATAKALLDTVRHQRDVWLGYSAVIQMMGDAENAAYKLLVKRARETAKRDVWGSKHGHKADIPKHKARAKAFKDARTKGKSLVEAMDAADAKQRLTPRMEGGAAKAS